ncbi:hypothetical protein WA026_022687 [Henosepilachna vigintioctopunctata]|uniref:Uncharacterized protein n=1 Tax=Henosepilachna vigintioctopunctata TaxID=420089 RepID=A0AAW1TZZ0_9CUCU
MLKRYKTVNAKTFNINILLAYQLTSNYMEELQQQQERLLDVLFDWDYLLNLLTSEQVVEFIEQATAKLRSKLKILQKSVCIITILAEDKEQAFCSTATLSFPK